MSLPAEELLDIRKLMSDVMGTLGWRQDGPTIAEAVEKFSRRVPRQQTPGVWRDLVALLAREVIRDHQAHAQTATLRERISAVQPEAPRRSPQPEQQSDGTRLWHRSESPGFTDPDSDAPEKPPISLNGQSTSEAHAVAAVGGKDSPRASAPAATNEAPAGNSATPLPPPPAPAPQVKFASPKIQALHDLWPELETHVEVAPGQRKQVAKCGIADVRYLVGVYADKKDRATKVLAEAGKAITHWQGIRDALLKHGAATVEDLPAEVKDHLFQRRAA